MKFLLVVAFVAAVSADVSHLNKYLPPAKPAFDTAISLPTKDYLPPVAPAAPLQPAQQYFTGAPAPSFPSISSVQYDTFTIATPIEHHHISIPTPAPIFHQEPIVQIPQQHHHHYEAPAPAYNPPAPVYQAPAQQYHTGFIPSPSYQPAPAPVYQPAPAPAYTPPAPVYQAPAQQYHTGFNPSPSYQPAPAPAASYSDESGYSYRNPNQL